MKKITKNEKMDIRVIKKNERLPETISQPMTHIVRLLLMLCTVALIFTIGGCKHYTMEEQRQMILDALQEKYGEEFVGISYSPGEVLAPNAECYVYPKDKGKGQAFSVQIGRITGGKIEIYDNYYGLLIKDEYEKVVRNLLDKAFPAYALKLEMANNTTRSNALNRNTPLDRIHTFENSFSPKIYLSLAESSVEGVDVEAEIGRFMEEMADKKLVCRINAFVYKDDIYKKISERGTDWTVFYSTGINEKDLKVWEMNIQINEEEINNGTTN